MAVTVCPWCQSEITHDEGTEPEKRCPICENEMDGYRTLRIGIGDEADEEEEASDEEGGAAALADDEDLSWVEEGDLREKNQALLQFEETVEGLLDEQETVPECPQCREYMLEAGELRVTAESFRARVPESLGEPVLKAPFSLAVYVCPSCFHVLHSLAEQDRNDMALRLSRVNLDGKKASRS